MWRTKRRQAWTRTKRRQACDVFVGTKKGKIEEQSSGGEEKRGEQRRGEERASMRPSALKGKAKHYMDRVSMVCVRVRLLGGYMASS